MRRGQTIVAANQPNDSVFVIRSGAIDVLDPDGLLLDRREAGRCFGYSTLVSDRDSLYTMLAVEDSLLLAVERPTFDAMLQMAELDIDHLPGVDEGEVTGIITAADIMRLLQHDPIYLTADLSRRKTPEQMREVYQSAHTVVVHFIERGAGAEEVQGVLSVAADAMARRLLRLAEEQLGPPPVPYSFVALGSQGRREMGLASDQDNALVLSEDYRPELHGEYFRQLGSSVCQGLATAGQVLYPGEMMAMTDTWRMTVGQWRETFHAWITAPEPEALLYAQMFFDMRWVHGEEELAHSVHVQAVESAAGSPRLHAHLAALATRREPPVGFFRGLVVDRRGKYANTLDIKKGGIAAVV